MRRAVAIAVALHLALVALGFLSRHDTLLDLIAKGGVEAVAKTESIPETTVELLAVADDPPPATDNPAFVVPKEEVEPIPPEPPKEPEPVVAAAPETPELPLAKAEEAPPVSVPAPVETAPSPVPAFAAQEIVIGNKDFPKPPYPYAAKRKHYEGTVTLDLSVTGGQIVDIRIARSSGYTVLDTSAASWIRQRWKFAPEVTRTLSQAVTFQLSDG